MMKTKSTPQSILTKNPVMVIIGVAITAALLSFAITFFALKKDAPIVEGNETTTSEFNASQDDSETNPTPSVATSTSQSTPTTGAKITLSYNLPAGWQTVENSAKGLSVGYDPNQFDVQINTQQGYTIALLSKTCCTSVHVKMLPYDGGSRHTFILKSMFLTSMDQMKTDATVEKEYVINGKSALMIYNVSLSGTASVGMIATGNNQAVLIDSAGSNRALLEKILATVKVQ